MLRTTRKVIRALRGHLKRLIQELVRTNSVAIPPDGDETPAQQVLQSFFREHGVRAEMYPRNLGPGEAGACC
jgi:acetylornithine deacetylase